jgi:hypothetical protein
VFFGVPCIKVAKWEPCKKEQETMADINRTIQELLVDYAGALRDGSMPVFLKSLTREEGRRIASSRDFWDGTEVVRMLNSVGFAEEAVRPNVSLFISRVDAEIASRLKRARAPSRGERSTNAKAVTKTKKTEKPI